MESGKHSSLRGQLGTVKDVMGEGRVVGGQGGDRVVDTDGGIGSGLGQLAGQLDGSLHLPFELPHSAQSLHKAAVCDLGLHRVRLGRTDTGTHMGDACGGIVDLNVGVDQVGHILAGSHSALGHVGFENVGTIPNAADPLEHTVGSLDAAQGHFEGLLAEGYDVEVLGRHRAIDQIEPFRQGVHAVMGYHDGIHLEFT